MKKIRIAQIGTNFYSHAPDIWNCLNRQSDLFEVVGYALPENERERLPQKVKTFGDSREMTIEEILSDESIEAVAVETDETYLTKYALMAAKAGKHIHMEKPGGCELSLFEELIDTMRKTGKVFHTGYMYRYNPYVRDLLARVDRGELGDIVSVDAQMNCTHGDDVRKWLNVYPGGMMFFLGCHLVDLIYRIQGAPNEVIPLNCSTGKNGVIGPDFGMAVFKYDHGVSFAKTNDTQLGGFARRSLTVTGTKGTVELCPLEMYPTGSGLLFTEKTEYGCEDWGDRGVKSVSDLFDRYDSMMASFASFVRGEKANPYTLDYELGLYRLVLESCGKK